MDVVNGSGDIVGQRVKTAQNRLSDVKISFVNELEDRVNQGVNLAFRSVLSAEISEGKSSGVLSVDIAGLEVLQEEVSVSRNIVNGQFTNTFSDDLSQVLIRSFRVVEEERNEVFLLEKLVNFNITSSNDFLQSIQKQVLEVFLFIQKINNNW